jgi:hypothetical protein
VQENYTPYIKERREYEIGLIQLSKSSLVVASQKKPFMALGKWKTCFSFKENENFLKQHCLTFQVIQICRIWDHLPNYGMVVAMTLVILP